MSTQVRVLRRSAFCGAAAICKIEVDGITVGQVKNGENCTFSVSEGRHSICFIASNGIFSGKVLQRAEFLAFDNRDIIVEIQFNGRTGNLDLFSADMDCLRTPQPQNVGAQLAVTFAIILLSGLLIYAGLTKLFSPPSAPDIQTGAPIQYAKVSIQDMLDELDANALRAEEKYQGKYIEITGEIQNFDSDGMYISISPAGSPLWIDRIMCYLTDSSHKSFLLEKNTGDIITVRGKVFSIGEVIGYSISIIEISN